MTPELELRNRASRGVIWLGLRTVFVYAIRVLRIALLARFLGPHDFGVFGLAMVFYAGIQTATTLGIDAYWIQRKQVDPEIIGTGWTLKLFRGAVVCGLVVLGSTWYGQFVEDAEVSGVLVIAGMAAVLAGLGNPGRVVAEREIRFGWIAASEVLFAVVESALVVGLAFWLRAPVALAWGLVLGAAVEVALSFLLFPLVTWPRFDPKAARELFSVGRHIMLASVGAFITTQADNLCAGMLLSTAAVGIYVVAYRLALLPVDLVLRVSHRVVVPTLSRLQDHRERLSVAFEILTDIQIALLVPVAVLLLLFPEEIVLALYGIEWLGAVPVIRALVLVMLGKGISKMAVAYLVAIGRFDADARAKVVELLVFLPSIYFGTQVAGLIGLALGAGASYMVAMLLRIRLVQTCGGKNPQWMKSIFLGLGTTVPSVAVALLVSATVEGPFLKLAVLVTAYGILYSVTFAVARPQLRQRVWQLVVSARK